MPGVGEVEESAVHHVVLHAVCDVFILAGLHDHGLQVVDVGLLQLVDHELSPLSAVPHQVVLLYFLVKIRLRLILLGKNQPVGLEARVRFPDLLGYVLVAAVLLHPFPSILEVFSSLPIFVVIQASKNVLVFFDVLFDMHTLYFRLCLRNLWNK